MWLEYSRSEAQIKKPTVFLAKCPAVGMCAVMSWCNCNTASAAEPQGCESGADVLPLNMVKQAHRHADERLRSACRKLPSTCCCMSPWRQRLLCLTVAGVTSFELADLDVRTSKSLIGNGLRATRHRDTFATFQYLTGAISDKVRTNVMMVSFLALPSCTPSSKGYNVCF